MALVHSDIGTGDEEANAAIASFLSGYLTKFLRPGGLIMADADVLALPEGVKPGRYFIYRRHP